MTTTTTPAASAPSPDAGVAIAVEQARVQRWRGVIGGLVVIAGDLAIILGSLFVYWLDLKEPATVVPVFTSAFAAVVSLTSAYFGIRAASNVAQSVAAGTPATPAPVTTGATTGPTTTGPTTTGTPT